MTDQPEIWLAPLRGVTIRTFREAFAGPIREAGFAGAFAPFIPANPGLRVSDRLLDDLRPFPNEKGTDPADGKGTDPAGPLPVVPQIISKDPAALRVMLDGLKARGFDRADLNAGCPFPMIRRRGRGSGLFKTPDVLEQLLATGCEVMGPGKFSLKIRLGLDSPDDLQKLLPRINRYPLAVLTVHARTAKQMYEGTCDRVRFTRIAQASANPVMYNGDFPFSFSSSSFSNSNSPSFSNSNSNSTSTFPLPLVMVGRNFVRALGARDDAADLLRRYVALSQRELNGDRPVLGRMKELLGYWRGTPRWNRLWPMLKICRTVDELLLLVR